jgi:hypothetical protein
VNRLTIGLKTRLPLAAILTAVVVGAAACGDAVRQSRSSSFLVIDTLTGASGAEPTKFSNTLDSDVVTVVQTVPTVYEDPGQVTMRIAMKDPGTTANPTTPSPINEITVNRYHVQYTRSDGRNTPGVDVPYAFDGAVTGTITDSGNSLTFVLVRAQAKLEGPLQALAGGGVISTLATVTFYGVDQAGNSVSVSGTISVNFANWGDPQ